MDEQEKKKFLLLTFQSILECSPDMIFIKDINLTYVAASRSFAKMVGVARVEDLIGKTDFDFFEHSLAQKYTTDDHAALSANQNILEYIEPMPSQNGKNSYSSTSKFVIHDAAGRVIGLYGVARDVTAQVELEAERESSRLSRQMFDDVLEADLTLDKMLRIEGHDWVHQLGVSEASAFSETMQKISRKLIHPDYREDFLHTFHLNRLCAKYEKGMQEFTYLTSLCPFKDQFRWVECRARLYHSRVSDTLRITIFLSDVNEAVHSKQRLQQQATTDALTGLPNRANVLERITDCLSAPDTERNHALLFIDLDGFKQVNDSWGHQFGDRVLQQVAERLRALFEKEDIFGRVGGDEFLVFLRHISSRQAVEDRASQVTEILPFRHHIGEKAILVTCSVGVAFCADETLTLDELYDQADKAMYQAKKQGKNQVFFFEDL